MVLEGCLEVGLGRTKADGAKVALHSALEALDGDDVAPWFGGNFSESSTDTAEYASHTRP